MNKKSKLLIFLLFTGQICFSQIDSNMVKVDHYKTNNFDVAIFPENSLDLISGKRFTPTRTDIDKAELVLKANLKKLNKELLNQTETPIIHKKLNKYKRQYFGYIDESGQRILLINCFWEKDSESIVDKWLKEMIIVCDGGSYYWQIKYNLATGELFGLSINGYA